MKINFGENDKNNLPKLQLKFLSQKNLDNINNYIYNSEKKVDILPQKTEPNIQISEINNKFIKNNKNKSSLSENLTQYLNTDNNINNLSNINKNDSYRPYFHSKVNSFSIPKNRNDISKKFTKPVDELENKKITTYYNSKEYLKKILGTRYKEHKINKGQKLLSHCLLKNEESDISIRKNYRINLFKNHHFNRKYMNSNFCLSNSSNKNKRNERNIPKETPVVDFLMYNSLISSNKSEVQAKKKIKLKIDNKDNNNQKNNDIRLYRRNFRENNL